MKKLMLLLSLWGAGALAGDTSRDLTNVIVASADKNFSGVINITLTNPRLDFLELPIGNLGFRFLRNLVVTFDPKNRRVQFRD